MINRNNLIRVFSTFLWLKNTLSLKRQGLLALLSVFLAGVFLSAEQPKPNFVFILADDQGWNSLSIRAHPDILGSGSQYYRTPHLDQLARDGMRFSQAYAPAPTCSPTRYAIQFGRSPSSLGIWGADNLGKDIDAGPADALANRIKAADPDYVCAHMGKWHVAWEPSELGYDVD